MITKFATRAGFDILKKRLGNSEFFRHELRLQLFSSENFTAKFWFSSCGNKCVLSIWMGSHVDTDDVLRSLVEGYYQFLADPEKIEISAAEARVISLQRVRLKKELIDRDLIYFF